MARLLFVALMGCGYAPGMPGASGSDAAPPDMRLPDAPKIFFDAPPILDAPLDAPPGIPKDCQDALGKGVTTSGAILIDPDGSGGNAPFMAYCDQTDAGGGWTLVWSYGFVNYNSFSNLGNAVTPRPTWGMPAQNGTATSTTVPQSPAMTGALDYAQWPVLGTHFLVASNINNWIHCDAGTGSLVPLTAGTISCTVVNVIDNIAGCTATVPTDISLQTPGGPDLEAGQIGKEYYLFDGSTQFNWPTHDPCGTGQANQLKNVASPGGQLYLRRN